MTAALLEQTATFLTRRVHRWDRRRRLVTSVLWGPRGAIAGLVTGIVLAVVSRLRPWLLPEEILILTAVVLLAIQIVLHGLIWLWPHPLARSARYFDLRFGLKERISTALEMASGTIRVVPSLAPYQLHDAADTAARVRLAAYLPVRVRWLELMGVVVLAILFAVLVFTDNPQTERVLARRELDETLQQQIETLEQAVGVIEADPNLTEVEQQALKEPLQEAIDILSQPEVTQQEAVAAMAEARDALETLSDGMMSGDAAAYNEAARELAGSALASEVADALGKPDLGATADALESLARDLPETDSGEAELRELADRLEQAAERLAAQNPALAEKLRQAAEALRRGDVEAAQQALREAAALLRKQEEFLENSPLADEARALQQQVTAGQQELAQVGREPQAGDAASQGREQSDSFPQSQAQTQADADQQMTGEGAQPQAEDGDLPSGAESGVPQPGEGAEAGPAAGGTQSGGPSSEQQGVGASGSQPSDAGDQAQSVDSEGESSLGEGMGEGGAGVDTTAGVLSESEPGQVPPAEAPDGGFYEYEAQNEATTIGGESDQVLDVGGEVTGSGGLPQQEGEFSENPAGESRLSYAGVFGNYRQVVSDALESGRIPLDQRDVIHDYFSSLER